MAMPALRHHWTAVQVRALIEESPAQSPRYELIGGELLVTPAPAGIHQVAVSAILFLLLEYLEREPVGIALTSPSDISLQPESIVQPDVFVVPRYEVSPGTEPLHPFEWAEIASLLLAVEVLSPSSERTDRVVKRDYYMTSPVGEYWVVDVDARVIERWRPDVLTPEPARNAFAWQPAGARTPLEVNVAAFFAKIWGDYRAMRGRAS
jgi:Uma2 family endonuclease